MNIFKSEKSKARFLKCLALTAGIAAVLCPEISMAQTATSGLAIGDVAMNASKSINGVQVMIQGACYMAGVALAGGSMFKFKAHKDNPQQTPLSTPIVMLAVAAGLLYLPSLMTTAGQSLWGGSQNSSAITYQYSSYGS
jgi:intracellular multiplication protein IcmD